MNYGDWVVPGSPGDNPCGWHGVDCTNGRVTSLGMGGVFLSGVIPPEIGNLTELKSLYLDSKGPEGNFSLQQISGSIPPELGKLANLEYLSLSYNAFSGTIPASLGNLVKLKYLDLSGSDDWGYDYQRGDLTGSIPPELGNLINLEFLSLQKQNLTGSIPLSLGNLVNLTELRLKNNRFSGTIPLAFNNLTKVNYFDLSYQSSVAGANNTSTLGGLIPDLSGIPGTAYVNISGNSFTFAGMEENIGKLDIYNNQAKIPVNSFVPLRISSAGGVLSVDAGGTIRNNTYKWFYNGVAIETNMGNSRYTPKTAGVYRVEVTNSVAKALTLVSENYEVTYIPPFPVILTEFSAKKQPFCNFLTWQTTSETTNKGFEIERSKDAINFENIGFVDGNGNSKATNDYSFLDKNPFPLSYYRLKQIDYDGKFEYSRIIYVKKDDAKLSFYPNPVKGQLFVSGLEKEENVTMHNLEGRLMLDQKLLPSQPINTSNFLNGLYIIKVGEETRKVVIQN